MPSLGPDDRFALVFAVMIAATVAVAWRRRHGPWVIGAAAFLPAPIVALFSREFDLAGWHGFMHAAPIYQIMERGGLHPEEPLFAGGPLRYPWVEHWITAQVAALTGVNTHVFTLCMETVALGVFLLAVAWLASALTDDRVTIALAALITLFGVSIFHMSFFLVPLGRVLPWLWLETRVISVDKFLNITAAPLGVAAMALAAAAGVHFATRDRQPRLAVLIAACTLVAVLVHPLSWLGILVWQGVIGVVLLASGTRDDRVRAAWLTVAVALPSAACLPYLLSVGASQSSDGWTGITHSASLLGAKVGDVAFYLVTLAVLAHLNRDEIIRRVRSRDRAMIILLLAIASLTLAYVVVRLPGRNEYKFLLDMAPAAAILIAMSLRRILDRRPPLACAALALLLVPGGRVLGSRPWFQVTDPVTTDGRYLRALDPSADSLFQWIAHDTPANAVFIAPDLRIPALGRRSLYIAANAPWRGRDGWGLNRYSLLEWHVRRPDDVMLRRQHNAATILASTWDVPASAAMAFVEADVPGRPIYVHANEPETIAKLEATAGFNREFAGGAGAVFEYLPSRTAAGTQ
jgi:hypothetical protein